ncbi:restriction endonuclease [Lysobacter terrae]
MSASSLLLATIVTVALGGAVSAWLWLVLRPRVERDEGLKLLAAMRWREFSRLVVDGLRSRGFEPEAVEEAAERGQDSVIHLKREGREWLLACKHGLNYRITQTMVADMADAIRFHGSAGGVVATLGESDADARRGVAGTVQVLDGNALWPLVQSQLSSGVRDELAAKATGAATRHIALAWAGAATLGLVTALTVPVPASAPADTTVVATTSAAPSAPVAARPAPVASGTTAEAVAPVSENEERDEVIRMVTTLPGVERAMWSTRSTLLVYLTDEGADPVRGVCDIVVKYDALRTSRVHLQPPTGATRPARFLQCATF